MVSFLKAIFLISALITTNTFLASANNHPGEIRGTVKDTVTNQSIEYATVALYSHSDSILVTGTITDTEGNFTVRNIAPGRYFLKVTCLGYREESVSEIVIGIHQKKADIGEIRLKALAISMEEVVISADRKPVEYHIDKDVINVEQSSNVTGEMAADVLENHPAIETGMDGTVKLRGSTNFIVLIDGKPAVTEDPDILNQIPAAGLERIEIITNPSARYEANHASGIINLITKSSELNGFSGILDGSVSNAETHSANISLNFRNRKLSVSTGANLYRNPIFQDRSSEEKRIVNGRDGFQNFHSDNILLWAGKSVNAGADYFASDKNTLSAYVNRGRSIFGWSPKKDVTEGTAGDTGYYIVDDFMRNYRDAWHFNLSDVHRFNQKGHQVNFDAHVIVVDMSRVNDQYLYNSNSVLEVEYLSEEYELKRYQDITRQQYNADYSLPFGNNSKLESGALVKLDQRTIKNDIITHFFLDDKNVVNGDTYESYNNQYAAYATITHRIFKIDLQAGLRMEYANRNTRLTNGDFDKTYHQFGLFPSLHLSRQFVNNQRIRFGYSRSIWRPTDLQLNPTIYFRDISGEFSGNAEVRPSYTNSAELNYNRSFKESSVSVTGFYTLMRNNIMTIRYQTADSVYRNSPENLKGRQQDVGVELSGNFRIFKWLTINPSGKIYNGYIKGDVTNQKMERRTNVWSARVIANVKPFKGTRIQLNTYYNSPTLGNQFYIKEIYGMSLSVKQKLFNNKLDIGISGNDILLTEKRKFVVEGDSFNQRIIDLFPKHPVLTLSVMYKFNNFNKKQRENVEQGIGFF